MNWIRRFRRPRAIWRTDELGNRVLQGFWG